MMATTYDDFESFAQAVEYHRAANPDWVRLNGRATGGDQNAWGYFHHDGRKWKVDADSNFLPILLALAHWRRTGENPFRIEHADKRDQLVVIEVVREELYRHDPRYQRNKYLYIYESQS